MIIRQELQQSGAYSAVLQADAALEQFAEEKYLVYRDQLVRLRYVINYCREKLEHTDLQLLPITHLNTLQEYLEGFKRNLDEFAKNNDVAQLKAADSMVDSILNILIHFPPPPATGAYTQNQSLKEYNEEVQKLIGLLRENTDKFEHRFKEIDELIAKRDQELTKKLEEKLQEIDRDFTEKNTRISEELKKQDTEIASQKARLDTIIADYNQQFLAGQSSRLEAFNTSLKQLEEQFNSMSAH